jgi:hypothetical protein
VGVRRYLFELDPNSNQAYAKARVSTDEHPVCPVCEMDSDLSIKSIYKDTKARSTISVRRTTRRCLTKLLIGLSTQCRTGNCHSGKVGLGEVHNHANRDWMFDPT